MTEFRNKFTIDDCKVIKDTGQAILVETDEHGAVWVPQSQIDDDSEVSGVGDEGRLIVSEWIAKEKGWI